MSSGVTPWERPPSVIARFEETGVRMPIRSASLATFLVPTLMPSAAKTELSENVRALAIVDWPAYSLSKLLTTKSSLDPFTLNTRLRDGNTAAGEMPCRRASARMKGLIDEPGWRWPWVARLNGDLS